MPLLRDNLQPTDFADAIVRVTPITPFEGFNGCNAFRIWMVKCTHHWFQRHEWFYEGRNQSEIDDWIYVGHHLHKRFPDHMIDPPL